MLSINNLNIQFGNKHLFKEVTARINKQDRIGLVGVNGTGKSTLLKILAGIIESDQGVVLRSKRATIGYLPQEADSFPPGRTLYDEAKTAFDELFALQRELEVLNHRLGTTDPHGEEFAPLLAQQGELQHLLDQSDLFQIQSKTEQVLLGLGFKERDFGKDCNTFSGGWIMRLMLAKLLLTRPAYLLLDEPTNHLDIETLTWLEEFLKNYPGAMVIISHDRSFLDNLTTGTWELSLGKLATYKGNYTKYLAEKEVRQEVHQAAYANQQAKIQQTMRFVDRFRSKSTKAKQAQSRLKQLDKMEKLELEDSEATLSFRFPPSAPSGRLAIAAEGLSKSYEQQLVFDNLNLELDRGDKLAVVGVNGAGKSTLAKLLAGQITGYSGQIRLGHNVKISYFGQHQAKDLAPELSVLQTMEQVDADKTMTQVRSLLGAFLFRGDEVDKKVKVLSGGEKSRLALAKMISIPANLLIMDEPTNHLDMNSQEILQAALAQYDGSIIIVSHNRHFLDQFVNKVLEIKEGKATIFEGNISDYLARLKKNAQPEGNAPAAAPAGPEAAKPSGKEARQLQAKLRQERTKKLAPLQKKVAQFEKDIENLEEKKAELLQQLADPELYRNQTAFADRSQEYGKVEARLKRTYSDWELLQTQIEELEAELNGKS